MGTVRLRCRRRAPQPFGLAQQISDSGSRCCFSLPSVPNEVAKLFNVEVSAEIHKVVTRLPEEQQLFLLERPQLGFAPGPK